MTGDVTTVLTDRKFRKSTPVFGGHQRPVREQGCARSSCNGPGEDVGGSLRSPRLNRQAAAPAADVIHCPVEFRRQVDLPPRPIDLTNNCEGGRARRPYPDNKRRSVWQPRHI